MKFLGVDVGVHGGLAILEFVDGAAPLLVDAIDVPTIGSKAAEGVDVLAIRAWVQTHRPDHAVVEILQIDARAGRREHLQIRQSRWRD